MRFEGNSRGITRSDYQQFTHFLGASQPGFAKVPTIADTEKCIEGTRPIAMVYGVKQAFAGIYEPDIALETGTIFEELNKPFYPTGCRTKNREGCL